MQEGGVGETGAVTGYGLSNRLLVGSFLFFF